MRSSDWANPCRESGEGAAAPVAGLEAQPAKQALPALGGVGDRAAERLDFCDPNTAEQPQQCRSGGLERCQCVDKGLSGLLMCTEEMQDRHEFLRGWAKRGWWRPGYRGFLAPYPPDRLHRQPLPDGLHG